MRDFRRGNSNIDHKSLEEQGDHYTFAYLVNLPRVLVGTIMGLKMITYSSLVSQVYAEKYVYLWV